MNNIIDTLVSDDEIADMKEFISNIIIIPKEDRAFLMSNANAFKVRHELEKIKNTEKTVS